MTIRKHLTLGLAIAALALGFSTVKANAQQVLKGTFELPAAVYWGNTLLQPGQYTIWMNAEVHDIAHVPAVHVSGEGVQFTLLTMARPARESAQNYLEIADINGTPVVRAFDAGLLGESFRFAVTKTVKDKALRASAGPVTTVSVNLAGF